MNQTPCENCRIMKCRTQKNDCFDIKNQSRQMYQDENTRQTAFAASRLIDDGRAGTLSRVEEVIEYCKDRNYKQIGIAYCFGLKKLVTEFTETLRNNDLQPLPVSCTAGGVKENEIDENKTAETTSCNPAGQALVLNNLKPDLVIEIGLCLGHDIIFHKLLQIPHTVLIVKDRVLSHSPASFFSSHIDPAGKFLQNIDDSFRMRAPEWVENMMNGNSPINIVDVRLEKAFNGAHIKNSINIPLRELPVRYGQLDKDVPTVCVCNGAIQSAYAVMFLSTKGFSEVYNLSGGFARWQREERG